MGAGATRADGSRIIETFTFRMDRASGIGASPEALGAFARDCARRGGELGMYSFTVRLDRVEVECHLRGGILETEAEIEAARARTRGDIEAIIADARAESGLASANA